jgi:uncharacterized protein (DUF2062 family)
MPKRIIKRFLPADHTVRNHRHLRWLGVHLHDPNLWHLNRRSVAGAAAVGMFMAFVPVPFQMVLAAAGAIIARVNLPVSVALVWTTNPLTMPPLFYSAYRLGALLMGQSAQPWHFELSMTWLTGELQSIWQPFLLGSLVIAVAAAAAGYGLVRLLWRWVVVRTWQTRRRARIPGRPQPNP